MTAYKPLIGCRHGFPPDAPLRWQAWQNRLLLNDWRNGTAFHRRRHRSIGERLHDAWQEFTR